MKTIKTLLYIGTVTIFTMAMVTGVSFGATVSTQYEPAVQQAQGQAGVQSTVPAGAKQATFAPKRLSDRDRAEVNVSNSQAPVTRQRYKPSKDGEGEPKTK